MLSNSNGVVEITVGELGDLVDEADLEKLVDDLEDEVFGVEVGELGRDLLVDVVESEAFRRQFELAHDIVFEFFALIADLVHDLVRFLLHNVEETLFFELCQTLLQQVSRVFARFV